ncbi:hypothetical protein [Actinocorallia lasiicapitis]
MEETEAVRTNVVWVVAQVLAHADNNLDPVEFAVACGVKLSPASIKAGLRMINDKYHTPGGVQGRAGRAMPSPNTP